MARVFPTGGPTKGQDWDFIQEFAHRFPELVEHMKAGHVLSRHDTHVLNSVVSESDDMKYAVAFYLRKYVHYPDHHLPKEKDPYYFGLRYTDHFIDSCFTNDSFFPYYQHREEYLDAFLDFVSDNPRMHKHYFDVIKSWEATADAIATARRGKGGGSGGRGGGNDGGHNGDGGPQGFDPL